MKIRYMIGSMAALALCGCAASPVEHDYGNSVRSLREAQTANPRTLAAPSSAPVTGIDQQYAAEAVKALRESASKPEETRKDVLITLPSSK
jgi:endonuclease V-like protein UPF0215 family